MTFAEKSFSDRPAQLGTLGWISRGYSRIESTARCLGIAVGAIEIADKIDISSLTP
jgi:hypothetical protein